MVFGFFAGESELGSSLDGGEGLVMKDEGEVGKSLMKLVSKNTNFLSGFSFATIRFERESEEEGFDISLRYNFGNAP